MYTLNLPASVEDISAILDSQDLTMEVKPVKTISDFADKIISIYDRQRLLSKSPLYVAICPKKQLASIENDLDALSMKARQYIMVRIRSSAKARGNCISNAVVIDDSDDTQQLL